MTILITFISILILLALAGGFLLRKTAVQGDRTVGATFSVMYAEYLGLDWREAFTASLDELQIRHFRIPVYWSRVEGERGDYDWSELDWIMDEAEKRGAKVTIATGMKVPRWPECFVPEWAEDQTREELKRDVLRLVSETVERYKGHPALERWQVENEPFFPFGECPKSDVERYEAEIALVRELDPDHPIVRTTSGEQSVWPFNVKGADVLGVSLYRVVYNQFIGYMVFPIPPVYYAFQGMLVSPFTDAVIISELQAEPWLKDGDEDLSAQERYELFSEVDLLNHMAFARRTGIEEVYLWGIEWWYLLKHEGDARLWEAGKQLIHEWNQYE